MMGFIMWCHTLGMWRRIFAAMVTISSPVFSSLTLGQVTTHGPLILEGLFWGWKCASKPNFGADFLELSQDFKSLAWSDPSPDFWGGCSGRDQIRIFYWEVCWWCDIGHHLICLSYLPWEPSPPVCGQRSNTSFTHLMASMATPPELGEYSIERRSSRSMGMSPFKKLQ